MRNAAGPDLAREKRKKLVTLKDSPPGGFQRGQPGPPFVAGQHVAGRLADGGRVGNREPDEGLGWEILFEVGAAQVQGNRPGQEAVGADSWPCRSRFLTDVDHHSDLMAITIPT